MSNRDYDVILASLKLARAMKRCPPDRGAFPFPPAVGRLLECAAKNPGVSSRELCEILDLRPSSLSEMLTRAGADGLLTRNADETDRRIQRISLTEKGQKAVAEMETIRGLDAQKKASCFTVEEKEQFCILCDRLSGHLERLALDMPEDRRMPPPPPPGPGFRPHGPGFPDPSGRPDFPPRTDGRDPDRPLRPDFPPEVRFKC